MQRLLGVIDIGTNTILYLKTAWFDGCWQTLIDGRVHYRTGSPLDGGGNLSREYKMAMRTALSKVMQWMTDCTALRIVATEVLRRPADGLLFAQQLSAELGWSVEVISAKEEAQAALLGVLTGKGPDWSQAAVIDIGGGSTELAVGTREKLIAFSSLPLGAVYICEIVGYERPLEVYLSHARSAFEASSFAAALQPSDLPLIAVGGTAFALGALVTGTKQYDASRLRGVILSVNELANLLGQLAARPFAERRLILEFDPDRADILVSGGAILLAFLQHARRQECVVSPRGLRHGIMRILQSEVMA